MLGGPEGQGRPSCAGGEAREADLESPGGSGIRDRRSGIGSGSRNALEDLTRLRGTQYSEGLGDWARTPALTKKKKILSCPGKDVTKIRSLKLREKRESRKEELLEPRLARLRGALPLCLPVRTQSEVRRPPEGRILDVTALVVLPRAPHQEGPRGRPQHLVAQLSRDPSSRRERTALIRVRQV